MVERGTKIQSVLKELTGDSTVSTVTPTITERLLNANETSYI